MSFETKRAFLRRNQLFPQGLVLESKQILEELYLTYEIHGYLNKKKDNVIWIMHPLTADAHVCQSSAQISKQGWWDTIVGSGKAIDTDQYCVICCNVIGSCKGSSGPLTINPRTQKPYGLSFPMVTIGDMVEAQHQLKKKLKIQKIKGLIGASMGAMLAIEWLVRFPGEVEKAILVAGTSKLSAQSIAFNEVGRNAIMSDSNWKKGNYNSKTQPNKGLAIARMIGHITYLSEKAMHFKFGRRLQEKSVLGYEFTTDFQIESYLKYQGLRFVEKFDANSYLYLTKAMDYFDLSATYGHLDRAMARVTSKMLIISISSDWLFPTKQSLEILHSLMRSGKEVSFCEIQTDYGHDAFLIEKEPLSSLIREFFKNV